MTCINCMGLSFFLLLFLWAQLCMESMCMVAATSHCFKGECYTLKHAPCTLPFPLNWAQWYMVSACVSGQHSGKLYSGSVCVLTSLCTVYDRSWHQTGFPPGSGSTRGMPSTPTSSTNATPMQQQRHLYLIFMFHWCIIDDSAPYVLCCKTYQNILLCLSSRQPYIKPKQGRIKLVPVLLPSCKVHFFTLLTYLINTY